MREGMKMIYAKGFHGTSVDAVLAAAQVPKGSFYHHFGSKEAFAQALLDRYQGFQTGLQTKWIEAPGLSTSARLIGYFGDMVRPFIKSGYRRACFAGMLSAEVASESDIFREQLDAGWRLWQTHFVSLLRAGQKAGDVRRDRTPETLAAVLLAMIQGAFVVALSTRDEQQLDAVTSMIGPLIDAPATGRRHGLTPDELSGPVPSVSGRCREPRAPRRVRPD